MYDDILVPTDGSAAVDTTLEHAIAVASPHDATIHVLSVMDRRLLAAAASEDRGSIATSLEAEAESAVATAREQVEAAELGAVTAIREGTPSREIVEYADAEGVDLIAIGTHGKSPREKIQTMGSVSERVVDSAEMPVLVVSG